MRRTLLTVLLVFLRLGVASAALVLVAAPPAIADLVTVEFTGVFKVQVGPLPDFTGSTLSGSFTFDTATPDSAAVPIWGVYVDTLTSLSATVASGINTFSLGATDGDIVIINNDPFDPVTPLYYEAFRVVAAGGDGVSATLPGFSPLEFLLSMDAVTAIPAPFVTSTALDDVPPPLFDIPEVHLVFDDGFIIFSLTELERVPEPSSLLLVGAGLVTLGGIAWRRGQRQPHRPALTSQAQT